jgi:hypothetical protein
MMSSSTVERSSFAVLKLSSRCWALRELPTLPHGSDTSSVVEMRPSKSIVSALPFWPDITFRLSMVFGSFLNDGPPKMFSASGVVLASAAFTRLSLIAFEVRSLDSFFV